MTEAIYLTDSYMKEFDAKVVSVKDDKYVVLDKTQFYPQSGGQPTDTGVLKRASDGKEFKVVFAKKIGEDISHEVAEPGLKQGDVVQGVLDWENRYRLMRMHTAAHIISAIFHKKAGAKITGNQLGLEKSRIDFNLEAFDREQISAYIDEANGLISKGALVSISFMKREEAMALPEIVKLASVLPPAIKELRIVTIEGIDRQADGGTHVKNINEIGQIEIISLENKGKNNRRLYFTIKP